MGRIRRLASPEGRGKVEAALFLGLSEIGFLLPPRVFLNRWVANALDGPRGGKADVSKALLLARITDAAAGRLPLTARCLQRSLVLVWILRRRGADGRLRIGVRRTAEGVVAHAWVEVAGSAVNDSPEHCSEFAVLEGVGQNLAALAKLENVA